MVRHLLAKKTLIAFSALGVMVVAAGCGTTDTASSQAASTPAATAPTPLATIASLKGVSTTVVLDAGTASVLQQNGVLVTPVAPATASMNNGAISVSFPITGGNVSLYPNDALPFIRGSVTHSGGLTFSAGGKSLTVEDFVVDPGASTLTATVGGKSVMILELNGSGVQVSKDAAGHVLLDGTVAKLSPDAAAALNATFGVTLFKEGIPLGVVHIIAG